jgi:hypothetical protein
MPLALDHLAEHINQLVLWLRNNPNTSIPNSEKKRLHSILTKILNREDFNEEEWQMYLLSLKQKENTSNKTSPIGKGQTQPTNVKIVRKKPTTNTTESRNTLFQRIFGVRQNNTTPIRRTAGEKASPVAPNSKWMKCDKCNQKLKTKNLRHHIKKCRGNSTNSVKHITSHQTTSKPEGQNYNPKTECKEERRLDGSRDYVQFRESGKFGSHSGYDDMADESLP